MLNDPKILILDEPTAGLDPNERVRFRNLLSELAEERLVLLSTHIVSDVEYIAGEILLMEGGQLRAAGTAEQLISTMSERVWSMTVQKGEADTYMKNYKVSNVRLMHDGVELRLLSGERPAAAALRADAKEWAGVLDEEKIRQVIAENKRITTSPEYLSDDLAEREIAYSWGQGIGEIRQLLNYSYAAGFRDYDYYRANELSEADAPSFYANRSTLLKEWLAGDAKEQFSEDEKAYLISQYESLQTPFAYDYMKGWSQLFEFAATIVMITMLILGYLVAGIFSGEFSWKSDAVFFSSVYGRNKATAAKIKAGFSIVSAVYFVTMLIYTVVVLLYLGADGWYCPIQVIQWKAFYHMTVWQEYLLILAGGYIGCLFISFLSMLVSAKTKSAVTAVIVPFALIFLPSFIANINSPLVNKILGLLPDQLLQIGTAVNFFNLYSIGQTVLGAIPILFVLYGVLTLALAPAMYQAYRHKQIG